MTVGPRLMRRRLSRRPFVAGVQRRGARGASDGDATPPASARRRGAARAHGRGERARRRSAAWSRRARRLGGRPDLGPGRRHRLRRPSCRPRRDGARPSRRAAPVGPPPRRTGDGTRRRCGPGRSGGPDRPQRPADRHRLGSAGRRAFDRRRFRPSGRHGRAAARARLRLLARARGRVRGGGRGVAPPRSGGSLLSAGAEPARAPSRNPRPPRIGQRRGAGPRRLRRPARGDPDAREGRRGRGVRRRRASGARNRLRSSRGGATPRGGWSGATPPMRGRSKRSTSARPSSNPRNCSIRAFAAKRRRRCGRAASGSAAPARSSAASGAPSRSPRSEPPTGRPASPTTFPRRPR